MSVLRDVQRLMKLYTVNRYRRDRLYRCQHCDHPGPNTCTWQMHKYNYSLKKSVIILIIINNSVDTTRPMSDESWSVAPMLIKRSKDRSKHHWVSVGRNVYVLDVKRKGGVENRYQHRPRLKVCNKYVWQPSSKSFSKVSKFITT